MAGVLTWEAPDDVTEARDARGLFNIKLNTVIVHDNKWLVGGLEHVFPPYIGNNLPTD